MSGVSYAFASFFGTFLECVSYGMFISLLIPACYVQWKKFSGGGRLNPVMGFATVFFGFTLTTNCALSLVRTIRALLYHSPGVTAQQSLSPPFTIVELIWWGIFQVQIVVADAIMVYRMYYIYDRNPFVCIVPSITIVGLLAIGCGLTNQARDLTTPSNLKIADKWSSACFSVTLFNSLFPTVAISLKLWGVHRDTVRANLEVKDSVVLRAMKVLIESAALWTASVAMNFFAFLAKSNLKYAFVAMTGPAVGISFCLIVVRLGQILPEVEDEKWSASIRAPASRTPETGQTALSLAPVKILNSSGDLPAILRSASPLSAA